MGFDADIKTDLDKLLVAEFGETIRFKPDGGSFSSISAFVENEREDIGIPVSGRVGPIFVTVSKTDISSVNERKDIVEWDSREYTVNLIESEDASGWRLYCVR